VHQFLGDLLLSYKQRAAARQAYEAAVQSNPRLFSVQLDIARMDIEEGRMDDVRKRVSLALAADSRNSGAKFLLGWLDEGAREYAQAEADYAEAIDADPSNVQALNNLGFLLATKLGKPTEALKYAQKAKELAPYDPEVSDTLGWIFYEEGLYESALPYLRAAVAADPSAPHRFHLAMAFWKAGDRAQAQETFSAAMRLGSNSAEALEAKRVLSQQ
jgi:tetratricopeptide (TPR) repeat protein